jgi:hypothetical protein
MRIAIVVPAAFAALVLVASGCGSSSPSSKPVNPNAPEVNQAGDIPDNQAFVAYSPPDGGYTVKVPEGWARTANGGAVTFTDKLNAIRIESAPAAGPMTVADARRSDVPRLGRIVSGFQAGSVSVVSRRAGKAVLIRYLAASRPDPVTGKAGTDAVERYVFFGGGKRVTLTLSGRKGADNVDPWRIVTDSLRLPG